MRHSFFEIFPRIMHFHIATLITLPFVLNHFHPWVPEFGYLYVQLSLWKMVHGLTHVKKTVLDHRACNSRLNIRLFIVNRNKHWQWSSNSHQLTEWGGHNTPAFDWVKTQTKLEINFSYKFNDQFCFTLTQNHKFNDARQRQIEISSYHVATIVFKNLPTMAHFREQTVFHRIITLLHVDQKVLKK